MGRLITKDKYHNNRTEIDKQRKKDLENVTEEIAKVNDHIESE